VGGENGGVSPIINGNGGLLQQMKGTGVDVIELDWMVDM